MSRKRQRAVDPTEGPWLEPAEERCRLLLFGLPDEALLATGAVAALMGATIIKVKPPKAGVDLAAAKPAYDKAEVPMETLSERVAHVMQAAFAGRRLVVFSGGEAKGMEGVLDEIRQIRDGGGHGSIIGRNSFQRPKAQALELLDSAVKIYLGQA